MAFLDEEFNVDSLPQGTSNFEPLPEGWYNATITSAQIGETKAGDGKYIKVRYDITGPSHQGRVIFSYLNIKNASTKAEEIGRAQLGEIMRAIGLAKVTDTDQLIGKVIGIKLTIKRDAKGDGNDVRGYKAIGSSPAAFPAAAPAGAAPAAKSATPNKFGASPWAKKTPA